MTASLLTDLSLTLPEIFLAISAMVLLMVGVFAPKGANPDRLVFWLAIGVLVVTAGLVIHAHPDAGSARAWGGMLAFDAFTRFAKIGILAVLAIGLWVAFDFMKREGLAKFEFPVLILTAGLGMMVMVSADNLLALYIGLELQSLSLYVMAAFNRDSLRSAESGLKYFVLGALSSGLLLYGMSMVYGFTGSTDFVEIARVLAAEDGANIGVVFGLVFILSGLAFKVSAAPFHMWTPDVYEGAPTPVTALFAGAPKIAAMALLARILLGPLETMTADWQQVVMAIAALSMIVGSFGALVQTNIKRLMAYSSIANMGYALVALSAGTVSGLKGLVIYMAIYAISTVGIFACIMAMRRSDGMAERLSDLAGLSRAKPGLALALTALLFSVAGIPPLAGFFGKFLAFAPAVEAGLIWLVVVGVLTSVVGAFYYLRIIKIMWFDEPGDAFVPVSGPLKVTAYGSALAVFPVLVVFAALALAQVDTALVPFTP